MEFFQEGNGATWTLIADQSPGHPGNSYPIVSVEGCGLDSNGGSTIGIIGQFPEDDGDLNIGIFCGTYVGSYDPNDKLAVPGGVGPNHDIEADLEIEYTIRFQNTGTAPARTVLVLDTLDPWLDISTFRMVSLSHTANWQVLAGGVLQVEFPDINLPDSTSDEPNSHGFIRFAIYPDQSIQPGARIEGRAAIYFDFNPPIITNTVFHTISEEMYGVVAIDELLGQEVIGLEVFPNPFREKTTFRMEERLGPDAEFALRNLQGQIVHQIRPGRVREFEVRPGNLPAGVYFFRLGDGSGASATGKLMIYR